jgi:hypothetical protein
MSTSKLDSIVDNWINGNRADAKAKARNTSHATLVDHLVRVRDWSHQNAHEVAKYLKGGDNYQAACDATAEERATFSH